MAKKKTKRKVSITLGDTTHTFLSDNFENKSKYIEYLIYKDMQENNLIKEIIL